MNEPKQHFVADRLAAVHVLQNVIEKGQSLDNALLKVGNQSPMCQALSYGVLRYKTGLLQVLNKTLDKGLPDNARRVEYLLLTGLYQLATESIAKALVVNECVEAVREQNNAWAAGLVNAVLRNADDLASALAHHSHPGWLRRRLKSDWADQDLAIMQANNQPPPMHLRVNTAMYTAQDYLSEMQDCGLAGSMLLAETGIALTQPVDVTRLPEFAQGACAVQDQSAQFAAGLLKPKPSERILDACASPGGKTAHLYDLCPSAQLFAVESDPLRAETMKSGMQRLGVEVQITTADIRDTAAWSDGQGFDKILADVPCSGTGVIRRHPDIKWLRRGDDIDRLVALQAEILEAIWPLLKVGGQLLYTSCSVLKAENERQIEQFLARHDDAQALPIALAQGAARPQGWQILPGVGDGFYYASLLKR